MSEGLALLSGAAIAFISVASVILGQMMKDKEKGKKDNARELLAWSVGLGVVVVALCACGVTVFKGAATVVYIALLMLVFQLLAFWGGAIKYWSRVK